MDIYRLGHDYVYEIILLDLANQPITGEAVTVFAWNQTTGKFSGADGVFDEDNEVGISLTERTGQTSFAGRYYKSFTPATAGIYWFVTIIEVDGVTYRFQEKISVSDWIREIWTQDMSAMTGEADRSPLNAIRSLRNKVSAPAGGPLRVYKENDSTEAWSATITEDDDALPITGVDPS